MVRNLALVVLAALVCGCNGAAEASEWVTYNARLPEFALCDWQLDVKSVYDDGNPEACWTVIPPADHERAISLTDDACTASTEPLEALPSGTMVYEFGPVGRRSAGAPVTVVEVPCR